MFAAGNLASFAGQADAALNPRSYGFPFPAFVPGDGNREAQTYITGLLLNIALPITLGLLVVWIVRLLRRNSPPR